MIENTKPRRGRPPKEDAAEEAPKKRRKRGKVGGFSLKLDAPTRDGFQRRWVNDANNRLAELDELGYNFVNEKGIKTDDPGSRVARIVGTKPNGEPLKAYLMETPDELYAEGVADKEARNAQVDAAIKAGKDATGQMDENTYGQGSITVGR